ncbi:hypothetical protein Dimus_003632 [Dionaea muscipula]
MFTAAQRCLRSQECSEVRKASRAVAWRGSATNSSRAAASAGLQERGQPHGSAISATAALHPRVNSSASSRLSEQRRAAAVTTMRRRRRQPLDLRQQVHGSATVSSIARVQRRAQGIARGSAAWQRHEQQQSRSLGGSSGARTAARQRDQRDGSTSSSRKQQRCAAGSRPGAGTALKGARGSGAVASSCVCESANSRAQQRRPRDRTAYAAGM